MNISYDSNYLIKLMALNRNNEQIVNFINQADPAPEITKYKESGINYEYVEFKEYGTEFLFKQDILDTIFLYSGKAQPDIIKFKSSSHYSRYKYPLPLGINFEQSKSGILALLGKPLRSGGGMSKNFGLLPDWAKYRLDKYFLCIESTLDCTSIQMVTILNFL